MITRAIKFDDKKWAALSKLAKEKGTTAAALIREAAYSVLQKQKESSRGKEVGP